MMLAAALLLALAGSVTASHEWREFLDIPRSSSIEQLFLNFASEDSMQVSWVTDSPKDAAIVQYGTSPSSLTSSAKGTERTYTYGSYTSEPQLTAVLTGLKTATTYYYRVGDGSNWSPVHSFKSHPGVGADIPYTFGVIGDLGQTTNSNDTVHHVLSNPSVQSVILAGDLSYADGDQPRWDSWRRMVEPLTSGTSLLSAAGNHEMETLGGQSFVPYRARFTMPSAFPSTTPRPLYYAMSIGPVRLIVLNSFGDYSEGSQQLTWFKEEIKNLDLSVTPWVVTMQHTPLYCSNVDHHGEGAPLLALIEDDLYSIGSRVVNLAGHVHAYERSSPVYKNETNSKAPIYVTVGDGGNREGLYAEWYPKPSWSAFRKAEYGHGTLSANRTHLSWQWHTDDSPEGTVSDSFTRVLTGEE